MEITKETAPKYGKLVELLPDGEPNGVIKESLLDHVKSMISTLDMQILKEVLVKAQYEAFSQSLTSVQSDDIGYMPNSNYDMLFTALKELDESGDLNLRISEQCLLMDKFIGQEFFDKNYHYGYGNNKYRVECYKILSDDSLGARTAALRNHYNDDETTKGIEMFTQEDLNELALLSHKQNCPVAIHAIGDRAIEMALDSIENAKKQYPSHNPRHGIVHCQITDYDLLDRFKDWTY
jgi:predicted amidohydrolase YtcJ